MQSMSNVNLCQQNKQIQNKIKNIITKERISWRTQKKTTRRVMINTFSSISSRPEGILHHLCKFYISCTECKGCDNLKDSLIFREDFRFDSVGMLFHIFGPR